MGQFSTTLLRLESHPCTPHPQVCCEAHARSCCTDLVDGHSGYLFTQVCTMLCCGEIHCHAGQCGCLNHEDYSQISHGEVSEKYLRSLFNMSKIENCMQRNNLTKGDVFDKADYIFITSILCVIKIIIDRFKRDLKTTT